MLTMPSVIPHEPFRPLRVLAIAHTGVKRSIGRMRYEPLLGCDDLELRLIVPDTWREYGTTYHVDPPSGSLDVQVVPVRWVEMGPAKWYLHHYKSLGRILSTYRPDVIHLWEEPWSLVALQAMWLRDRILPRAALVLETEQNILRKLPLPFELTRRLTLRRTDLLVARQEEAEAVSRACGYAGPVQLVRYGVDSAIFHPDPRPTPAQGLGADPFIIGYVGRLIRAKGLFDVLDALTMCDPSVHFHLMGSGPDRAGLELRVQELKLGERVRFIEAQPLSGVADFMQKLDSLVLMSQTSPTWKEQFGRVVIEAQACGKPVIGSSSGAIPSVIGAGGWVVPEGDAAALATLLERLYHDRDEVARAGTLALANVASRFTYERISEQLRDAYVTAAASPRCQTPYHRNASLEPIAGLARGDI